MSLTRCDEAVAVSKFDNLQFLSDTVPKTMTYKQIKERKAVSENEKAAAAANGDDTMTDGEAASSLNGQRTIASMIAPHGHGHGHVNGTTHDPPTPDRSRQNHSMAYSPIVDRTVRHDEPNGHAHPTSNDGDIEMQD